MTKKAIFVRKIVRSYSNKRNWEYSKFKGYPNGTYFGYSSFDEYKSCMLKKFTSFYGDRLRTWRYI